MQFASIGAQYFVQLNQLGSLLNRLCIGQNIQSTLDILTLGKNESQIAEYIQNQLKEDRLGEQLSIPEAGLFTGGK